LLAEEPPMPRALSRDEQAILALVRRREAAIPVPELADQLHLAVPVAQAACDYLVSRGLLHAAVYAVAAPMGAKQQPTPSQSPTPAAISSFVRLPGTIGA